MKKFKLNLKLAGLFLALAVAAALVTHVAPLVAFAQTAPVGPCTGNPVSGNPVFVVVSGIFYGCPIGATPQNWTQFWPVPSAGLAAGSVNSAAIASAAVGSSNIIAGAVNNAALQPNTAIGATAVKVCHATYSFAVDGGVIGAITPVSTCVIPINAVIFNVAINSTTAVTSTGSATMSVGTTAGSSGASMVGLTGKASYSSNAFVQGVPVPQTASTWVKMSAAGSLNVTVAVQALTAGVVEIYAFYYESST